MGFISPLDAPFLANHLLLPFSYFPPLFESTRGFKMEMKNISIKLNPESLKGFEKGEFSGNKEWLSKAGKKCVAYVFLSSEEGIPVEYELPVWLIANKEIIDTTKLHQQYSIKPFRNMFVLSPI